ncbi:hypothetical protein [Bacillus toyonensis]|uniref:hypothetical protein n=1 Tax=Bacillus toyonensis TaxID=155322 RepID=UPI002E1CAE71|nr:hypothetical protein [Bacillus toyonensis]
MGKSLSHDSLWEKIEYYLWGELEKQWPYFWSEDANDLALFIRQEKIPGLNPQKMIKSDLQDVLNSYMDHQTISVNLLTDKYPELKKEIESHSDIGIIINIDWYTGRGRAELDYENDTKVMGENIRDTLMKLGYSSDQLDLMSAFTPEEAFRSFERNLLEKHKDRLDEKWSKVLKDEISEANKCIRDIINNRVFQDIPFLVGK